MCNCGGGAWMVRWPDQTTAQYPDRATAQAAANAVPGSTTFPAPRSGPIVTAGA